MIKELSVKFLGRVQGVGFRVEVCEIAGRYMVDGWVMNTADGSVEMLAQGEEAEIESFLHGIEASRLSDYVDRQQKSISDMTKPLKGFNIRY